MNQHMIIGFVGARPQVQTFQNGGKVANLRVATSESWKDKATGERKERTEWHNVSVFGDALVDYVESAVDKGTQMFISGQSQTRTWKDKDGNDRSSVEIRVGGPMSQIKILDRKNAGNGDRVENHGQNNGGYIDNGNRGGTSHGNSNHSQNFDDLSDIPF